MATIKDIARAVGVSHATVSNVLNHKGNVSAQKVKLVMDAANALGYRVNEAASAPSCPTATAAPAEIYISRSRRRRQKRDTARFCA